MVITYTKVATGQENGPGKNSSRSWKGHAQQKKLSKFH